MLLPSRVADTIHRHALVRGGGRVLVALSGGADSVALLFILRDLAARGVLQLAGAAHLHHGLRGADADADQVFCAALAGRLGVPFVTDRVDVAALARAQKRSVEDAARTARYAFLEQAAASVGADSIAVAHTTDDQAETFLLRLLRGAGTRGLGSIRPRAGRVIRPLIDVERGALREYLTALGEPWREDATNADTRIPRNRVRHELIPYLGSHFSSSVTAVLSRGAALAREDEDFLHEQAIDLARRIVLTDESPDIRLDAHELARAPRALGSRIVQQALERHAGRRGISFDHVDAVLALAGEGGTGPISLPGQDAWRVGDTVVLRSADHRRVRRIGGRDRRERESGTSFAFALSIPGEVELAAQRLAIAAERLDAADRCPTGWVARGSDVGVAAGALELPLGVRTRRPGDRFHPLGAPGPRKLQDFFVDRKVAREERDRIPLVVDGRDRIVWVVGQSVAQDFRVTDPARGVILLKVRHLGGVG